MKRPFIGYSSAVLYQFVLLLFLEVGIRLGILNDSGPDEDPASEDHHVTEPLEDHETEQEGVPATWQPVPCPGTPDMDECIARNHVPEHLTCMKPWNDGMQKDWPGENPLCRRLLSPLQRSRDDDPNPSVKGAPNGKKNLSSLQWQHAVFGIKTQFLIGFTHIVTIALPIAQALHEQLRELRFRSNLDCGWDQGIPGSEKFWDKWPLCLRSFGGGDFVVRISDF